MIPCCGKCGSTMVYLDQDVVTGSRSVACIKCGNRYPGGIKFYLDGMRREDMSAKKECTNCARVMEIVRRGLCWSCNAAAGDLEGEEREKALAAIKSRIALGFKTKVMEMKTKVRKPCETEDKADSQDLPESVDNQSQIPDPGIQVRPPRENPVIVRLELEIGIRFRRIEG